MYVCFIRLSHKWYSTTPAHAARELIENHVEEIAQTRKLRDEGRCDERRHIRTTNDLYVEIISTRTWSLKKKKNWFNDKCESQGRGERGRRKYRGGSKRNNESHNMQFTYHINIRPRTHIIIEVPTLCTITRILLSDRIIVGQVIVRTIFQYREHIAGTCRNAYVCLYLCVC